ncbi:unnamed protein product [Discosporangium mesarthrocarpum]
MTYLTGGVKVSYITEMIRGLQGQQKLRQDWVPIVTANERYSGCPAGLSQWFQVHQDERDVTKGMWERKAATHSYTIATLARLKENPSRGRRKRRGKRS